MRLISASMSFALVALLTGCSDRAATPQEASRPAVTCSSILDASSARDPNVAKALGPPCAMARAGLEDDARKKLAEALAATPALPVPADFYALLRAGEAPGGPFATAEALANAGFVDEAAAELQSAIRENPTAVVPRDLKDLRPETLGPWRELRQRWGPWLLDLGEVMAVVVLLLFVVLVVLTLVFRATLGRFRAVRDLLPLRRPLVLSPPANNGDKAVEAMAVQIREELCNLDSEAGGRSVFFVDAPAEALGVPQLSEAAPQVKYVDAALGVLQRIAPRDIVELTIILHPPSTRGAGITVTLTGHTGRLIATTTLWETSYYPEMVLPKPDDGNGSKEAGAGDLGGRYGLLAAPAAVWILYCLRDGKDNPPLDTRRWESYALFKAGTVWLDRNDMRRARVLFHQAIRDDRGNIGARVNLARIAFQEEAAIPWSGQAWSDQAKKMTEFACYQIAQKAKDSHRELQFLRPTFGPDESFRWDPLWYRAAFNLAVLFAHRYSLHPSEQDLQEAISKATDLVKALEETLVDLDRPYPRLSRLRYPKRQPARRRQDDALRHLLERLEPSTVIVLASMLTPRTCDFRFEEGAATPDRAAREQLLADLGNDRADHRRLIRFLGPLRGLDANGYYNIACYCSLLGSIAGQGPHADRADALYSAGLGYLRIALESGGWEHDAMVDPSLASLRQHRAEDFVMLIEAVARRGCTIRDELGLVDEESAKKLAQEGITSKRRLVQAVGRAADRKDLAKTVDIEERLLRRWANVADVLDQIESTAPMEILPPGFATLLHQAGAGSIKDFRALGSKALAQRLAVLNGSCSAAKWAPLHSTVESWSTKLQRAKPQVS